MYALFFSLLLFFLLLFVMNKEESIHENLENKTTSSSASSPSTSTTPTTYQSYSGSNPMILAQKNAANIQYLQEKLKDLQGLETNFNSLDSKVDKNTDYIKKMAQYAAHQITQSTGITPNGGLPPAVASLSSIANNPANQSSTSNTNSVSATTTNTN